MPRNRYQYLIAVMALIGMILAYAKGKLVERHRWHVAIDSELEDQYYNGLEVGRKNAELRYRVQQGSTI